MRFWSNFKYISKNAKESSGILRSIATVSTFEGFQSGFLLESTFLLQYFRKPSLRVDPSSKWRKGLRINERKLATTVPDF